MDRFIAFVEEQINSAFKYLKSNMDRFIGGGNYSPHIYSNFKIQYG